MRNLHPDASAKNSQVHIRLSSEEKSLLRRATLLQKTTMSDFLRSAIMSAAQNIIQQNADLPYIQNKHGEFVFTAKPRVLVFPCLYNFRDSRRDLKEWCDLYGIPVQAFETALREISPGASLNSAYQEWLNRPEDIQDESF